MLKNHARHTVNILGVFHAQTCNWAILDKGTDKVNDKDGPENVRLAKARIGIALNAGGINPAGFGL